MRKILSSISSLIKEYPSWPWPNESTKNTMWLKHMNKEILHEETKYILHSNHPEIGNKIAREYSDLESVKIVYNEIILGGHSARICLRITSVVEYQLT